jgi:hypothetical protein
MSWLTAGLWAAVGYAIGTAGRWTARREGYVKGYEAGIKDTKTVWNITKGPEPEDPTPIIRDTADQLTEAELDRWLKDQNFFGGRNGTD